MIWRNTSMAFSSPASRDVSFTGQSKNFPIEKAVYGERQIIIKNYAIKSITLTVTDTSSSDAETQE